MSDKLSERISRMVWAFPDDERKDEVRQIAKDVATLEGDEVRPCDCCGEPKCCWQARAKKAEEEKERLRLGLESICDEFERTIDYADNKGKGGQHVPFHGDFASACQLPSFVSRARWWARHLREVLGPPPGGLT